MTITASLFEAFLKCPTKCWLRATNEPPTGNTYAEWVKIQNESCRVAETERLLALTPPRDSALSPHVENLKTAKWRLAVDVAARTTEPPRSSQREEVPSLSPRLSPLNQSIRASSSRLLRRRQTSHRPPS